MHHTAWRRGRTVIVVLAAGILGLSRTQVGEAAEAQRINTRAITQSTDQYSKITEYIAYTIHPSNERTDQSNNGTGTDQPLKIK